MDINTNRQGKITHIGQLLPEQLQAPVPFEKVELTDQERELALNEAMVKKHAILEDQRKKRLAEERRNDITRPWSPNELYEFARARATQMIRYETGDPTAVFEPMDFQKDVITAMCLYFTGSKEFEQLDPSRYNTTGLHFSLQKGLWLFSNPGQGKTLLMQMFSRNKRQCYGITECPKIVTGYIKHGDDATKQYKQIIADAPTSLNFYQTQKGMCYNDLGTENTSAKFYGSPLNVMEDIFLATYEERVPFFHRHVTTNLTFEDTKTAYGVRFNDRIKQCFNIMEIKGHSLRK